MFCVDRVGKKICNILIISCVVWCSSAYAGMVTPPKMAYATDGTTVVVSWASVPEAIGYNLYYAPFPYLGPETIGFIDMKNETSASFNLWDGAAYYTAIKAYNDYGESDYSNIELVVVKSDNKAGFNQAVLGPLSGAQINAYHLNDLTTPIETVITGISTTNLSYAGAFNLVLPGIADDEWILVTATGGEDIDADDDGMVDLTATKNTGTLHALAPAGIFRKGAVKLNALTDMAYLLSMADSSNDLTQKLDQMSKYLVDDVNHDSIVDYADLLEFDPFRHKALFLGDQLELSLINQQIRSKLSVRNRLASYQSVYDRLSNDSITDTCQAYAEDAIEEVNKSLSNGVLSVDSLYVDEKSRIETVLSDNYGQPFGYTEIYYKGHVLTVDFNLDDVGLLSQTATDIFNEKLMEIALVESSDGEIQVSIPKELISSIKNNKPTFTLDGKNYSPRIILDDPIIGWYFENDPEDFKDDYDERVDEALDDIGFNLRDLSIAFYAKTTDGSEIRLSNGVAIPSDSEIVFKLYNDGVLVPQSEIPKDANGNDILSFEFDIYGRCYRSLDNQVSVEGSYGLNIPRRCFSTPLYSSDFRFALNIQLQTEAGNLTIYGAHNLIEKYFSDVRIDSTGCLELLAWYADDDGDGYGNPENRCDSVYQPYQRFVVNNTDCNDDDYRIHPGAKEIADDGIDQDCSGSNTTEVKDATNNFRLSSSTVNYGSDYNQVCVNEFGPQWGEADWSEIQDYYHNDGGNLSEFAEQTSFDSKRNAWVTRNGEQSYSSSRDYFASFHNHNKPSGYLAHDNLDNYNFSLGSWYSSYYVLCSKKQTSATTWYRDYDGDGYGNPDVGMSSATQPEGYVADNTDCNDNDSSIHPGASDIPDDGIDQDCSGSDATSGGGGISNGFPLPDTGQTSCYDTNGNVIPCAGTGQDGEFTINPMSFTDNGNGTVSDNVTGLMWQQQDDGTHHTWADAGAYCESLSLGGYSDWRLPNRRELMSIVDYGVYSPSINSVYFPGTHASNYWSSTSIANNTDYAWFVNFYSGYFDSGYVVDGHLKTYNLYARCVR